VTEPDTVVDDTVSCEDWKRLSVWPRLGTAPGEDAVAALTSPVNAPVVAVTDCKLEVPLTLIAPEAEIVEVFIPSLNVCGTVKLLSMPEPAMGIMPEGTETLNEFVDAE
jgi:hypothetical protein